MRSGPYECVRRPGSIGVQRGPVGDRLLTCTGRDGPDEIRPLQSAENAYAFRR